MPNAILFAQNLPSDITKETLQGLFQQYVFFFWKHAHDRFPGFKEVRMVPGKPDIAFVEYDHEGFSAVAKKTLHGYRIAADREIRVSFAKR